MYRKNADQIAHDLRLQAAAQKYLGNATVVIGGETYPLAVILATLEERAAARHAAEVAKATWLRRVEEARAKELATETLVRGVERFVHLMFQGKFDTLAEFGLAPPKPRRTLTADEKAAAAAKALATRAARHTMGKRAKARITGVVPPPPPPLPARVGGEAPAIPAAAAVTAPSHSPAASPAGREPPD